MVLGEPVFPRDSKVDDGCLVLSQDEPRQLVQEGACVLAPEITPEHAKRLEVGMAYPLMEGVHTQGLTPIDGLKRYPLPSGGLGLVVRNH